jgi:hypothetical protein
MLGSLLLGPNFSRFFMVWLVVQVMLRVNILAVVFDAQVAEIIDSYAP